ncbi:hypothetical protein EWM64_g3689 [Hericium alpestre]|uniref:FAD-binding domain-containing protein n=1 Tax=Hericium alpestre TaxID=135208 RepID=A0A4Z0A1W3_9AGAM|nr:hypothetical protein EWM64_g3689 [Hericium alpestre]
MSTSIPDVFVVGSGPTGLVTALTLAQNGVTVRIIEKLPHFPFGQRGSGVMPRTLEVYHFLGILDDVKRRGILMPDLLQYENGEPDERTARLLGQDAACEILREHLKKHGVEVELSTELCYLEQTDDGVTATIKNTRSGKETLKAVHVKYLVGADGARGVTRKLLDLSLLGETEEKFRILIGEVEAFGINDKNWHKFGGMPFDSAMLCPTDRTAKEGIFSLTCTGPELDFKRGAEDHDYLRQFALSVAQLPELKIGEIETIVDYRPNIRIVSTFQVGRVFVAGGCVLINSLFTKFNLAWKLALASKGLATSSLLETYSTERMPVITEMLQRTTAIVSKLTSDDEGMKTRIKTFPRPVHLKQLGVNYRWSSIVIDDQQQDFRPNGHTGVAEPASAYIVEEGGRLHGGDRAHDATGLIDIKTKDITRLFNVFGTDHHTILLFCDSAVMTPYSSILQLLQRYRKGLIQSAVICKDPSTVTALVGSADFVLHDRDGHAYAAYDPNLTSCSVAIVRPDGVVGALVRGLDGVERYFSRILAA